MTDGISPFKTVSSVQERSALGRLFLAYRLRWKRRRFLFRVWRKRNEISQVIDRSASVKPDDILCFTVLRNEIERLPFFLEHHRKLGVRHFFFVDNGSDDGSLAFLKEQSDVSLWQTDDSYRLSRFGLDWVSGLLWRYGHGHWCLTLDVDELLTFPKGEERDLNDLTAHLESEKQHSFGALMLDLYPKGHLSKAGGTDGNPLKHEQYFDRDGYWMQRHHVYGNFWIQGGVRTRKFFTEDRQKSPTLNKIPLVKWSRRYAYVNSTHQILPTRLHTGFDPSKKDRVTGALLHTKFLPQIVEKSKEELDRKQHFENSALYTGYHRALADDPILWDENSVKYKSSHQLVELGLISTGKWV